MIPRISSSCTFGPMTMSPNSLMASKPRWIWRMSSMGLNERKRRRPHLCAAYRAVSRGTVPEPTVPKAVRDGLHGDGFDVSAFRSDYTRGKDEIVRHVDALIDDLARGK